MAGPTPAPADIERTRTLWFALLLTLANGFLDAHTYIARGGVFANVQTANVIFFAIDSSERKWAAAMAHVWPLLAFIAGVTLASHINSGRAERVVAHPLRWTMAIQAVALALIGFVPATVAHSYVTVPISFLAAMQISLFRSIGDLAYLPVATTGNLMRFVEAGYDGFVEKHAASRRAFRVYGSLILAFAAGSLSGAVARWAWCVHAIWLPAGFLAEPRACSSSTSASCDELPSRDDPVAGGSHRRCGVDAHRNCGCRPRRAQPTALFLHAVAAAHRGAFRHECGDRDALTRCL